MDKFRITPGKIDQLMYNEVFVFESNLAGIHGAGAAKDAVTKFGAIKGKGKGIQGKSYAIPTKDENIKRLNLDVIKIYIDEFIKYAKENPKNIFLVTEVGCGLTGYKPEQIGIMFKEAIEIENVKLPSSFIATIVEPKREFKRMYAPGKNLVAYNREKKLRAEKKNSKIQEQAACEEAGKLKTEGSYEG